MESFVNNTEVSFSQLTKKDGWFSRLIFFHLIMYLPIFLLIGVFRHVIPAEYLVVDIIFTVIAWTICFLFWKKRTRFTIIVSIVLLWILFVCRYISALLVNVAMLTKDLHFDGSNNSLINNRIGALIYAIVFAVIVLVLTVRWTRNLRKLKQLQP